MKLRNPENYSIFCSELLSSDVMVIYTSKNTIIYNKQETPDILRILNDALKTTNQVPCVTSAQQCAESALGERGVVK